MICESCISSFPTILILRNTQVYIGFFNHCDVVSDIEASIDEVFCSSTTLRVPDIDLNYSHIWFGKSFDNLGSRNKNSVIKNMSTFDYHFNDICRDRKISIFNKVRDT